MQKSFDQSKIRVLLVDDDYELCAVMEPNLAAFGFDVCSCYSAEEALEILKNRKFDVIVSDVQMPGMSGLALFNKVSQIEAARPKFVFFTGFSTFIPESLSTDHGVKILYKPVDLKTLVEAIGEPAPHVLLVYRKLDSMSGLFSALKKSGLQVTGWEIGSLDSSSSFRGDYSRGDYIHVLVDVEVLRDNGQKHLVAREIREFGAPITVLSDSPDLSSELAALHLDISQVLSKNLHPDAAAQKLLDFLDQDKKNISDSSQAVNDHTSQFLAHIGHEIRTPLHGILGTSELLSNLDLPPLQASYVNTIKSSGNTLLLVLNDLLDFIRIQAKRIEFENVAFSIRDLIQESFELFGALSCKQRTDLLLNIHDGVPQAIYGDPGRLKQIFNNLLSNALKFTSSGQVEVSVKIVDEVSMLIEVKDNGEGVGEGKSKSLFEPFSQGSPGVSSNCQGSGLGLSICKNLVELMSGDIGYRPSPTRGSIFWFQLPLVRSDILISRPIQLLSGSLFYVLSEDFQKESWEQLLKNEGASIGQVAGTQIDWDRSLFLIDQSRMDNPFDEEVRNVLSNSLSRVIVAGFSDGLRAQDNSEGRINFSSLDSDESRVSGKGKDFFGKQSFRFIPKPLRPQLIASAVDSFKESETSQLNGLRVLVVDDNEANILVATRMLESMGCRPFYVSSAKEFRKLISGYQFEQGSIPKVNGSEAIDSYDSTSIDLIFMDCNLMDAKGYDLAKEIRNRSDSLGRVPIVGLTASKSSQDLDSCIKSGMNAVLQKPISIAVLRNSIEKLVFCDLAIKV